MLLVLDGDTILVMKMRRSWLIACAAQVGIVAGVGCGGRVLDEPPIIDGSPGSPSGDTWIAFDSDGASGNRDLYVIRADGTGRRRLSSAASVEEQPSFSPDGTKLAFAADLDGGVIQIYLMDLATGLAAPVSRRAEGAHDPAFTIDGTRIGYRSGVSVFTA